MSHVTYYFGFALGFDPNSCILGQLEGEEVRRSAKRQREHEKGRREATADMSEDTSEGEKGDMYTDVSAHGSNARGRMPRNASMGIVDNTVSQCKDHKLYIVLIRYVV